MVNSKIKWWKILVVVLLMFGSLCTGFFEGKKRMVPQKPIYIKGDTIIIATSYPEPVEVVKPCDSIDIIKKCVESGKYAEFFPERIIEKIKYVPTREDTINTILEDWATERTYKEKVFDVDTLGTATVTTKVQYNRITYMDAEVIPAIKEVRYIHTPKFSPMAGGGITTRPDLILQAGGIINGKYGTFVMYDRDLIDKRNIWGLTFMYKF